MSAPVVTPAASPPLWGGDRRDTPANRAAAVTRFEGLMLAEMLAAMRQAKLGDGLLDGGREEEWRRLGDRILADNLAARAPLGVGAALARTGASQ